MITPTLKTSFSFLALGLSLFETGPLSGCSEEQSARDSASSSPSKTSLDPALEGNPQEPTTSAPGEDSGSSTKDNLEEQKAGEEDSQNSAALVEPDSEREENPQEEETPPHPGPFLWVTRSSAAVYGEAKADRNNKLGYIKRGGKVGVFEEKVSGPDCPRGWYRVASGGFICSHVGTTDEKDKDVKYRPNQPNIEEILPYPYARNRENGTPLYKTVPTHEQTLKYEPYLPEAVKLREEREKKEAEERSRREALAKQMEEDRRQMEEAGLEVEVTSKEVKVEHPEATEQNAGSDPEPEGDGAEQDEVPLWEREENLHEVTLNDLRKDSDDVLAARMMKGFYVAVDKTIKWDGRTWYKTTKGLITPADRFYQTAGSDFHGVEIDGEKWSLPIGWVVGARKSTPTYEIDTESGKRKPKGSLEQFAAVPLQYRYYQIGDIDYFQMTDGDWIRDAHIRMTTPGPRPAEVGPNERWIDVDISEQTLVVFEGDRPVYATLISSGKQSKDKDKDHSTPRGMWRVREKHTVSTMDGDGSAAGDLPYSIEDVPYIMYFYKSYATHGAFWHRNYGSQMSHGCVNLAPLDAKWIFFYADPRLPPGFHGAWSSEERPGSMVVVHD